MWLKIFFSLFTLGLILADVSPRDSIEAGGALILEAELLLAKEKTPYLLLDKDSGNLALKARGVLLREWKIVNSRQWGFPFSPAPVSLLKKSALLPPEREEIKPGQSEDEDNFDIQALELDDMPKKFSLVLENDIRIHITPSPKGFARFSPFSIKTLRHLFIYPLATIRSSFQGKNYHVLEIEMESETEAQSLYWALAGETAFLIFQPNE